MCAGCGTESIGGVWDRLGLGRITGALPPLTVAHRSIDPHIHIHTYTHTPPHTPAPIPHHTNKPHTSNAPDEGVLDEEVGAGGLAPLEKRLDGLVAVVGGSRHRLGGGGWGWVGWEGRGSSCVGPVLLSVGVVGRVDVGVELVDRCKGHAEAFIG